jgi:hypothetical protein
MATPKKLSKCFRSNSASTLYRRWLDLERKRHPKKWCAVNAGTFHIHNGGRGRKEKDNKNEKKEGRRGETLSKSKCIVKRMFL